MAGVPTDAEILDLLIRLDTETADALESQWLEFKPWRSAREEQAVAIEYAICFANADGGAISIL